MQTAKVTETDLGCCTVAATQTGVSGNISDRPEAVLRSFSGNNYGLQANDEPDYSSHAMKTLLSDIGIELKPGDHPLLDSVSLQRNELTLLLKVYPSGLVWRIHFSSVVGVKVLDERDMPEYWHINAEVAPTDKNCAVSLVQQSGWSTQIWPDAKARNLIYEDISEYLLSGEDFCAVILSYKEPEILNY